jgi:oligopeptide transport system substrate-binding protein
MNSKKNIASHPAPYAICNAHKKSIRITFHTPPPDDVFYEHRELVEEIVQREFQQVTSGIPIVYCSPPLEGQSLFTACCIAEKLPDLMYNSPDLISPHLPVGVSVSSVSIYRVVFSVDALPSRHFVFIYNAIAFDGNESFRILNEQSRFLRDSITLSLKLPSLRQQINGTNIPPHHKISLLLHQKMVRWLAHHRSSMPTALLSELQRFLLATNDDFQGIRTSRHLLKLVSSHLWLKQKHSHLTSARGSEKWFYYRVFRTKLRFPFGTKDVVCLAISLHSLSTYEQFDQRHILLACKRCLPCLDAVPRSFYMYRYAEEPTLALYVELEKHDGNPLTAAEMNILKHDLGDELSASIEQVMSRIDIPQNEEDLLRNFILLSQHIQTSQCQPRVIVQFQGQSDVSLEFHVTLVRAVKKGHEDISLPSPRLGITRCIVVQSSIIDTLRTTYVKQGIVFSVECSKESFLRRDRSVDFLKARESVVRCIETAIGPMRDLNGGMIYQHHQLVDSVAPLLTKEEAKELCLVEDLSHALSPSTMHNNLGPEHMVTLFRQLLALRRIIKLHKERTGIALSSDTSLKTHLVEEYAKEVFIAFICPSDFVREELFQPQLHCQLEGSDIASCDITFEGHRLCFVVCSHEDKNTREQFTRWLREKIHGKEGICERKNLRISLSRPPLSLDPRIGADRKSGTVIKLLYEGLMRLDPSGNPTPAIAEEVFVSADGMTYTFKLRPTYWTNGLHVTAYDFEYAWKKILDPSFQTVFDYLLHPILNASLVKEGKLPSDALGIHAVNDTTLVVYLERPAPHFLELCCLWIYSPLCKDLDKTHPGWAYYDDRSYVCNGPFKLTKRSRNGDIQLTKNEYYWDKDHVAVEHVDIKIVEDPQRALTLYEQGELDWLGEPLSETPQCLFKEKPSCIHSKPMAAVQWFDFNVQHPPFRSAKVRQAFSYALDREALIKEVLYGDERPSHSILPPSLSLLDDQTPLAFDPEKAQQLFFEGMKEQGLTPSFLKPITIMVYNQEPYKSVARAVIRTFEKAFGLSFFLEIVSWNEFFERMRASSHDILGRMWYSWYKDPLYTLKVLQSSTNSMNCSKWCHDEYTALLTQAEAAEEKSQRTRLLQKAEALVMQQMPILPIFDHTSRHLKSDHIDNVYVSHLGNVDFKWTTFTDST